MPEQIPTNLADLDIDAITVLADRYKRLYTSGSASWTIAARACIADIPALLAEIGRLRARVAELETANGGEPA